MKKLLLLLLLVQPLYLLAQYSAKEIKKLKISKLTTQVANGNEEGTLYHTYFDKNGNDTAHYEGDFVLNRNVYSYDNSNRPVLIEKYDGQGTKTDTAIYTYQPDGSYKISTTDKAIGMTNYEWYDKNGNVTKTQSPDGAQRIYTYDAGGKLTRLSTRPGKNQGVIVSIAYSYNAKGQRIKEVSSGEYKWTTTYQYDSKGMVVKSISLRESDGNKVKSETKFSYEYWK